MKLKYCFRNHLVYFISYYILNELSSYFHSNPILEANRLWTLGVCGALRKLNLSGTPAADDPDYRTRVAAALPMLVYLDDRPMHTDIECTNFLAIHCHKISNQILHFKIEVDFRTVIFETYFSFAVFRLSSVI